MSHKPSLPVITSMNLLCQQKNTTQKKNGVRPTTPKRENITIKTPKLFGGKGEQNTNFKNLKGKRFGMLVAQNFCYRNGIFQWSCLCDCGKITVVRALHLNNGHTKSCGCLRAKRTVEVCRKNLVGFKFGRLRVISYARTSKNKAYWNCICDCGSTVVSSGESLKQGNTQSCGCMFREKIKDRYGDKNPAWNSSLTDSDRIKRHALHRVKVWRKKIFEKDDYTCQLTGQRGGKICAHHISSWNRSKSLRFLKRNGVTISKEMHILFHQIYGRGDNTPKQFKDFRRYIHESLN